MSAARMELGKFNIFVTVVVDITFVVPVRKGVEAGGVGTGEGIASGMAGGELVAGTFVAAVLLSRLI